jgi:hypothetical protein
MTDGCFLIIYKTRGDAVPDDQPLAAGRVAVASLIAKQIFLSIQRWELSLIHFQRPTSFTICIRGRVDSALGMTRVGRMSVDLSVCKK